MRILIIVSIITTLLAAGCVGTQGVIDDNLAAGVPDGAEVVIAETEMDDSELFDNVRRSLVRQGHRLANVDEATLSITTEGTDVGESTMARYTLYIEDGSVYGRADWMPGMFATGMAGAVTGGGIDAGWEKASWSSGRPQRAFASLVSFLDGITDDIRFQ